MLLITFNAGRRKRGIGKNVTKTISPPVQSNINSPVRKESKLDTAEKEVVKISSISETHNSSTHIVHSCKQVSVLQLFLKMFNTS